MPLRKDITNKNEYSDYDFGGWWVEQHVNEPADMKSLETKKHDGWWFDSSESEIPEAAVTEKDPALDVETNEAFKKELTELEKHQAFLKMKYAKTYKAQEKAEAKEEESDSDDYDSDASFQDFSSSSDEED